jgi:hypothetical protein
MASLATAYPDSSPIGARFDWYAATVNESVERLQHVLARELGGEWKPRDGARHGFQNREELELLDGTTGATLLHGGNGDLPHVYASSDACDAFVSVIRGNWPDRHKVSRMDAALDYDNGSGTWETLLGFCRGIADGTRVDGDTRKRAAKVSTNQMGDWHHGEKGRTFYLGSFKSAVLVRLYEKGIQLVEDAAKRGRPRTDISRDFCRLEIQVRPDGPAKERAARATPLEAFGYADWSRELLRRVEDADVDRVHIRERRESDHDRALNWMLHQYEAHILQEVQEAGGWAALGEAFRRRMETGKGPAAAGTDDERPF